MKKNIVRLLFSLVSVTIIIFIVNFSMLWLAFGHTPEIRKSEWHNEFIVKRIQKDVIWDISKSDTLINALSICYDKSHTCLLHVCISKGHL